MFSKSLVQIVQLKAEKEEALKKAQEYYNKSAKPGSLASKANMVSDYNAKNNKGDN